MLDYKIKLISESDSIHLRKSILNFDKNRPPSSFSYALKAFHYGAFYNGDLVSTASFLAELPDEMSTVWPADGVWRLRGMATHTSHRRLGLGSILINAGKKEIHRRSGTLLWCNGRSSVADFYTAVGFLPSGNPFDINGFGEHIRFVLRVTPDV